MKEGKEIFVKVGGEEERRRREHLAQKLDYLPEDY